MKWDDKQPGAASIAEPGRCVFKWRPDGAGPAACCICREPTLWADLAYMVWVCSEECLDRLESEYAQALARVPEGPDDFDPEVGF